MSKYNITAKEGDRRIFKPTLQGRAWADHEHYGKKCTVVFSGAIYDVHIVHIDGTPADATEVANGNELPFE
jgi:hypothetical protein